MKNQTMLASASILLAAAVSAMAAVPEAEAHHNFGGVSVHWYERVTYGDVDFIQLEVEFYVGNTGGERVGDSVDTRVNIHAPIDSQMSSYGPLHHQTIVDHYHQIPLDAVNPYCSQRTMAEQRTNIRIYCFVVDPEFVVDSLQIGRSWGASGHGESIILPMRDPSSHCSNDPTACDREIPPYIVGPHPARVTTAIYYDGALTLIWDRPLNVHNPANIALIPDLAEYAQTSATTSLSGATVSTIDGKQLSTITILDLDGETESLIESSLSEHGDMQLLVGEGAAHTAEFWDATAGEGPILVSDVIIVR